MVKGLREAGGGSEATGQFCEFVLGWGLSVGEDCGWVWVVEGEAKLQGNGWGKWLFKGG